jgi:ribosomal protein S18 acetylase RimI-like enzyme
MQTPRTLDLTLARELAEYLDTGAHLHSWLVSLLGAFDALPAESFSNWSFFWCSEPGKRCLVVHYFPSGTTYVHGDEAADWEAVSELCRWELLPERVIAEREVAGRWRRRSAAVLDRARKELDLDVLVFDPRAMAPGSDAPAGFRIAEPSDREHLERFERMHWSEMGLEPVERDQGAFVAAGLAFVVEEEGEVAGCVDSNLSDGRFVHVSGLFVLPKFRGRGLGEKLARGIALEVHRRHGASALVDVYRDNTAAQRAYAAAGYRKVGEGVELRFGEDAWS